MLLDTTFARRAPRSGTGVYLERLVQALGADGSVDLLEVANRGRGPAGGGPISSARNLASDLWWSARALPRAARAGGAQVIHHPLPAVSPGSTPFVITVHDLAFERLPECFDRGYRTYARLVHRLAARRAAAVIAVSEATALDLRELWGIPAERIVVAPLGPGQGLPAKPRSPAPAHFLYVGDAEPRKDLPTLLSAYARYRRATERPLELVLAGSAHGSGEGVRCVPAPDGERLAELHARALALVHPSRYEGFGLTPLEAMRAGTPVLAARSPGVSEVCGEAVRYVAAGDVDGFARAMVELASDGPERERLSRAGRERATLFSWSACARAHLAAYSLAARA